MLSNLNVMDSLDHAKMSLLERMTYCHNHHSYRTRDLSPVYTCTVVRFSLQTENIPCAGRANLELTFTLRNRAMDYQGVYRSVDEGPSVTSTKVTCHWDLL